MVTGIVSIGMTFVILTGGIDLSVGSLVGLTGVILGLSLHQFPIPVAIALAVLSGAGIGLFSGLLIACFDLAAFVITLGVMAIGRSLAYIFSGQTSISDIPPQLNDIVYTTVLGVQTNVWTLLVLYALAWGYLTFTKGGRTIYAVGSNREAARTAGLDVLFYSVLPYVVSGALSAVARDADVVADPVDRPARRHRARTGRNRRGGDRRGQPLWRPRHDHRHADRRVHHGDDPQRPQPARRVAFLAGLRDRRHHHRRRSGGTAVKSAHAAIGLREQRQVPKFAANLSMMFNEHAFLDRFDAAADAGFAAVEFLFPYDHPPEAIAERLKRNRLTQALFNLPPGRWDGGERGLAALPGRFDEFKSGLTRALDYVAATGVSRVHMMAGNAARSDPKAETSYRRAIEYAAPVFAERGVDLLLEPINARNMPTYFLNDFAYTSALIDELGLPNLKLQFDVYHRQIMHGDVTMAFRALQPIVGHIQVASVPSRNEPDGEELNFPFLFDEFDRLGYDGYIGCEYNPRARTVEGLKWFQSYRRA